MKLDEQFPPGTPVVIHQSLRLRGEPVSSETVGVVETWQLLPTGSWYAHGRGDKLWLQRLTLRKADGEVTLVIIDDRTSIARLEAASP